MKKQGFSLVELILVIAVIAALAGIILPSMTGTTEAAEFQKVVAAAQSLNLAQVSYRLSDPNALTNWKNAKSDTQKYALLQKFIPQSKSQFSSLTAKTDYIIEFQGLSEGVKIKDKDGNSYSPPDYVPDKADEPLIN